MNIRAATSTTHLGRYRVVKRLAAGGMADVLLARTDGIEGFQRHVVIKRIHAELLEEQRYVTMFLDEARLAASLHHHNIVQVNDIGEENGEYFFAMEYVHGEDARTLLVDASQRGEQIPIEHIVTIVMAAAAGLHHAHEQRGPSGQALNIVHRDVSPANILVGYDGAVKVADFGIALAAHRAEQTQSGVLKGKVAYMSPEQCNCDPVDRRSDVFSLGIVLYELATVRPCFAGDNDFMTMSAIVGGKVDRPGLHRKDLPRELEAIILKALALKPANRYQTADELRMALEEFAAATKLRTSTTALADYMKTQFGARALPWQEENDEPEIEMRAETTQDPPRHETPLPPRVPTQLRGSAEVAPARRERAQSPTMPMRAQDDDLAIPLAPRDRNDGARPPVTALESEQPAKPTLPLRTVPTRRPAEIVAAQTGPVDARPPVATEAQTPLAKASQSSASVVRAVQTPPPKNRRLWLAGSVAAVLVAGVSLVVVSGGRSTSAPRASAAPVQHRHEQAAPQPLERPVVHGSVEPMAAPAPAKKSHHSHHDAKEAAKAATAVEAKATEAPAAETKPADAKPADAKATEVKAADTKPADAKPADAKPADAKSGEKKPAKKWDPDKLFPK